MSTPTERSRTQFPMFASFICSLALLAVPDTAQALRQVVCIKADGAIVVKRRCRTAQGESRLDLAAVSTLAEGPQGEKGDKGDKGETGASGVVDIQSCVRGGLQTATGGAADTGFLVKFCPDFQNNYMLNYSVDLTFPAAISDAKIFFDFNDNITPIGIGITAIDPVVDGAGGPGPINLELLCCPRN